MVATVLLLTVAPASSTPLSNNSTHSSRNCTFAKVEGLGEQLTQVFIAKLKERFMSGTPCNRPSRTISLDSVFHNLEILQSLTPYPFLMHIKDEEILHHMSTRQSNLKVDFLRKWDAIFNSRPAWGWPSEMWRFGVSQASVYFQPSHVSTGDLSRSMWIGTVRLLLLSSHSQSVCFGESQLYTGLGAFFKTISGSDICRLQVFEFSEP